MSTSHTDYENELLHHADGNQSFRKSASVVAALLVIVALGSIAIGVLRSAPGFYLTGLIASCFCMHVIYAELKAWHYRVLVKKLNPGNSVGSERSFPTA